MAIVEHSELAPLADVMEPMWWTGTPATAPERYVIDATDFDPATLLDSDGDLAETMRDRYETVGLVHVVNTGLTDLGDQRLVARHVIDAEMQYHGGGNPRDDIAPNVYEIGAPLSAWLHYHHEMAYVGRSTRVISFLAQKTLPVPTDGSASRGATFVSDSIGVTDAVRQTELGRKLRDLGVCYHRNLTDREAYGDGRSQLGVYNHWQKSFGTDDAAEAELMAVGQGLKVEWGDDRQMLTRYYADAFEYDERLDRNVLYSSLADHGMWFDTWPMVQHLPYSERPLHMTFGDDSEFTDAERRQWLDLYGTHGTPINWRPGDVAVICNYRFAHGRPGIHLGADEERVLGVVL
ncbi:MAG: TauD/TfdA family dioxygenase, partial [Actinomycetota bacterium]